MPQLVKPNDKIKTQVKRLKKALDLIILTGNQLKTTRKRLDLCQKGYNLLLAFIITTTIALAAILPGWFGLYPFAGNFFESIQLWAPLSALVFLAECFIFAKGIILVYLASVQLGIKWRSIGLFCGMIPLLNIIALIIILSIVKKEIREEKNKLQLNEERKDQQICKTKYPLLLVHGVFFRDSPLLNYWGRIPNELISNGATVFYGNQDSSSSVMNSAQKLVEQITSIVQKTGCEKVNIIAHSKGGLDSRAAISLLNASKYVASLTTISTPHRGCAFADYLLNELSSEQKNELADFYNAAALTLGDQNPDFISAVTDLTAEKCAAFNEIALDSPDVFYQSFGSILNRASSASLPLIYTYDLVKYFDGPNDGLVGLESFNWGESFKLLTVKGNRGISHSDMIDLNRENIPDFDVREFYVNLVSDLKKRGF